MSGTDKPVGEQDGARIRARDVVQLLLLVALFGAVVLFGFGAARRLAREAGNVLFGLPGGGWAVGSVLGLVSVLGVAGGAAYGFSPCPAGAGRLTRVARKAVSGACWVAAVGPVVFLLSNLRARNCRSSDESCVYIAGTGPALLAYVVIAALVGSLCYRWRSAVVAERRARERERMRKLRKKGKGKSRAARLR
ncbi:hypothetical protein ACWD00_08565 [Streptomyces viridiviolaceus]